MLLFANNYFLLVLFVICGCCVAFGLFCWFGVDMLACYCGFMFVGLGITLRAGCYLLLLWDIVDLYICFIWGFVLWAWIWGFRLDV